MISLIVLTTVLGVAPSLEGNDLGKIRVYLGTYRSETSRGIYLSSLDLTTGQLSHPELVAEEMNPSFLAIHPTGRFLYAVSEVQEYKAQKTGTVCSYTINPGDGRLTFLNQKPSVGADPCHLVVDAAGKNVLVANYSGADVAVLPIASDGRLEGPACVIRHEKLIPNPPRQEAAHPHSINLDAANRFAFVADLGTDQVTSYRYNAVESLLTANPPALNVAPGSGPRHFTFHPSGRYAFVNNELSSTVTSLAYDADRGSLTEIQTLPTIPAPNPENSTAEVAVHPAGKFLYVSNRGHDSLAIFQIDESTGKLKSLGNQPTGGKTPRNFGIDPTGKFLLAANQDTNNVVVFRVDATTGKLTATDHSIQLGSPVCVRFVQMK